MSQQQYVMQTKFEISEMYYKINDNIQVQSCVLVLWMSKLQKQCLVVIAYVDTGITELWVC